MRKPSAQRTDRYIQLASIPAGVLRVCGARGEYLAETDTDLLLYTTTTTTYSIYITTVPPILWEKSNNNTCSAL